MSAAPPRNPLALIVAMTKARVIGKAGTIPWRYPEDSKRFRRLTLGHAVIMGRATYDSIGKPLEKRRNIVVSRNRALELPGCEVVASLPRALELAYEEDSEPFVIGGTALYAAALPLATRLLITEIEQEYEGDTYFPEFDRSQWRETERTAGDGLCFVTLERV